MVSDPVKEVSCVSHLFLNSPVPLFRQWFLSVIAGILCMTLVSETRAQNDFSSSAQSDEVIRFLAGSWDKDHYLAGIEINAGAGNLTYWRHPGEAGLTPEFNWQTSLNVKDIEFIWPVPLKLQEAGSFTVNGYEEHVLIPIRITPVHADEPVLLSMETRIGICKDQCRLIEKRFDYQFSPAQSSPLHHADLLNAIGKAPIRQPAGADTALSVIKAEKIPQNIEDTDKRRDPEFRFLLTIRAAGKTKPELFFAVPEDWLIEETGQLTPHGTDEMQIPLRLVPPDNEIRYLPLLHCVLVQDGKAVERTLNLNDLL